MIEILQSHKLKIFMQGNQHAKAFISGRVSEDTKQMRYEIEDDIIRILYSDDEESSCLFTVRYMLQILQI